MENLMAISFSDLGGGGASKIEKTEIITSTRSWTAPDDVTAIEVILCGGGSSGYASPDSSAGGGGGGGSAYYKVLTVTPATSYTITIGAGGSAPSDSSGTATTGNGSVISGLFTAYGGIGATSRWVGGEPSGHGGNGGIPGNGSVVVVVVVVLLLHVCLARGATALDRAVSNTLHLPLQR
jgi:hypothetical protein